MDVDFWKSLGYSGQWYSVLYHDRNIEWNYFGPQGLKLQAQLTPADQPF
jgi:hypothetical protein